MVKRTGFILGAAALLFFQGCQTQHQIELKPVEIKPIHITIDVNVKVDRALDDFFGDIDSAGQGSTSSGKTQKTE